MRYQPTVDDLDDIHVTASGAEPFTKPDHKSKKHPRPARKSEMLGGGHFVFRRHADGRIHPRQDPFEHGTVEDAVTEMQRLVGMTGERFEVYSRAVVGGGAWDIANDGPFYGVEGGDVAYGGAVGHNADSLKKRLADTIGPVGDCSEYYESMLDRDGGAA